MVKTEKRNNSTNNNLVHSVVRFWWNGSGVTRPDCGERMQWQMATIVVLAGEYSATWFGLWWLYCILNDGNALLCFCCVVSVSWGYECKNGSQEIDGCKVRRWTCSWCGPLICWLLRKGWRGWVRMTLHLKQLSNP
jgi:hypothetical protein